MLLDVNADLLELGLSACALVARGVDNTRTPPELVAYRKQAGQRLAAHWKNRSVSAHPAVAEYHRVHELFGALGQPPAPEKLITFVRRRRDFTAAGALVDCYNVVSARTLLSIGAHDLARFDAPITLRRCTDADTFVPLGQAGPVPVAGEYAYVDASRRVICRLEVLQGEHSKVTPASRDVAFFLQGNRLLPPAVLLKGAWLLAEMIRTFCGGTVELVDFHAGPAPAVPPPGKPLVALDAFRKMSLRVGTVVRAERNPALGALSTVTVRLDRDIEALALTAALPPDLAGRQVLVATGLHPLAAGGRAYAAYVPAAQGAEGAAAVQNRAPIPDGNNLF